MVIARLKTIRPYSWKVKPSESRGGVADLRLKPDCRKELQDLVSIGQLICNEIETGS